MPSGGHLTHGYYTAGGKRSARRPSSSSRCRLPDPDTGLIDYVKLEEKAMDFRPKMLICGGSAYPRDWDYAKLREIADKCGAMLMMDMAHISGLVAAEEQSQPRLLRHRDYHHAQVLRGPRAGMIFFRRGPARARASPRARRTITSRA